MRTAIRPRHVFQTTSWSSCRRQGKHWLNRGGIVDRALGRWELTGFAA